MDPLVIRPASALEPTADLRDPVFSTCTVPLLYYYDWSVWHRAFVMALGWFLKGTHFSTCVQAL